jgi:glycosyltransferase involved in cell wall biosynthesis
MRAGLILEQTLAPVPGGTGRYSRELAVALAATKAPHDTVRTWVAWHRSVAPALVDGVLGPRRLAVPAKVLARAWERGLPPHLSDADVVHAPTLLVPPTIRPLVVSLHDTVPWTHPHTLTPRGVQWHLRMAARAVETAAAVTVLTHAVGAELRAYLPDLDPERIVFLGAGVSPSLLAEPTPAAVARVRGLDLPAGYLLSLATLEPRKGLDVLIEALAQIGPSAPPLVVVGQPGWGGIDVAELGRRHGLTDAAVRVLGAIPDADLAVVMRGAQALVAPSRAEGFGLPIAEAMAVGTPVICSDLPAVVEVAAGAATLTPAGDAQALAMAIVAMSEHTADPARRAEIVRLGLLASASHTWTAVAERAWELYRRITQSEPGRGPR